MNWGWRCSWTGSFLRCGQRDELSDAGLDRFATSAFANGIGLGQALRMVRRTRWLKTGGDEIVCHRYAVDLGARHDLFGFGQQLIADGDVGVDFVDDIF